MEYSSPGDAVELTTAQLSDFPRRITLHEGIAQSQSQSQSQSQTQTQTPLLIICSSPTRSGFHNHFKHSNPTYFRISNHCNKSHLRFYRGCNGSMKKRFWRAV
jgi:hypothetical protein